MGKRFTGAVFMLCATLLYIGRYISASIYMSGAASWGAELFAAGLQYVGTPLLVLSVISFLLGAFYLVWAEITDRVKH